MAPPILPFFFFLTIDALLEVCQYVSMVPYRCRMVKRPGLGALEAPVSPERLQ